MCMPSPKLQVPAPFVPPPPPVAPPPAEATASSVAQGSAAAAPTKKRTKNPFRTDSGPDSGAPDSVSTGLNIPG